RNRSRRRRPPTPASISRPTWLPSAARGGRAPVAGKRPIIIDTDPGIDDALAIFLACASPELEIRAVTTVAGNVGITRPPRNASALVALAGKPNIPVFRGAEKPLAGTWQTIEG